MNTLNIADLGLSQDLDREALATDHRRRRLLRRRPLCRVVCHRQLERLLRRQSAGGLLQHLRAEV